MCYKGVCPIQHSTLSIHEVRILHTLLQLGHFLVADEVAQDLICVREGGGRAFARDDVAVLLEELACVGRAFTEVTLKSRGAGGFLAIEDARASQYHGGGADGAYSLACLVLCDEGLAHPLVLVEVGAAWQTTGEKQHVCIREVPDVLKPEIGLDGDAVGGLHELTARDADRLDVHAPSAEDVNRSQAFDFLEAVGKKFIYLCHNFIPFLSYDSIHIIN